MSKKIRLLIVDDSVLFREFLIQGLEDDDQIEVVGYASDPYMARDKIIELRPDVMTLDVNMPKMSGIEFLRRLLPQYPMPVVVVSGINNSVFEALEAGAVEFVGKPDRKDPKAKDLLIEELKHKIKISSTINVKKKKIRKSRSEVHSIKDKSSNKIIAIGASTGGTEAIYDVISKFPKDIPGVVIVQHMPPVFTKMYAQRLNLSCPPTVVEAQDGDEVLSGKVLIAPGDRQMEVVKKGGRFFVKCYEGEKVSGHCPSVDVLFDSVAKLKGPDVIAVLLTGMGRDGARGMKGIRDIKGITIGQDEQTSVVYGMPRAAYELGGVKYQLPLTEISQKIISLI
jgi:two-component system chemotaxis response regulator CheB